MSREDTEDTGKCEYTMEMQIVETKEPKEANYKEKNGVLEPILKPARLKEGQKIFQCLSTLIVGLMAMQSGMTLSWTSPTIPHLELNTSFLGGLDGTQVSWVSSLMPLGAVVGALPAGMIADSIGRKSALMITTIPLLLSWLMIIFLRSLNSLYAARFMGGIGSGAVCVLVPLYIGEVAEPSIRGALGSCFALLFSSGVVFIYIVGAYTSYIILNIACCGMLVPFLLSFYFLPESPIWLVQNNRIKEAEKSLGILRGRFYEPKLEITVLQEEADRVMRSRGGFRDLIGTRAGRKAIGTCLGLMWFQQMCGIDAVLFYTVKIFQEAESSIDPFLATIIIGLIEVVMAAVVAVTIDKFGRKPLLVLSGTAMTLCLGVLGYYFKLQTDGFDVRSIAWLPLTSLALFNVVFSLGFGSVPFAVISELFPPETKGVAISMSIIVNWTLVFVVTKFYPPMIYLIGQAKTFWLFASMACASAVFSFVFVPETKGKTLREIQTKLSIKRTSIKKVSAVETT
ncbi:facilitated trehalose transporter Tret1 [Diachasma alloeum]|uniref:facilitated trehalose transporter Tret1 n=1 Tax=Diachasma alloeum TaxID=454923 RepID=UPI00073829B8|nr:facilitated trehalose transporter Tret1 [Diachasma alloeum]